MANRRCGWCNRVGHNRRTCPKIADYVARNPNSWTARDEAAKKESAAKRSCSWCTANYHSIDEVAIEERYNHNRRTCPQRALAVNRHTAEVCQYRDRLYATMAEANIGIGSIYALEEWNRNTGKYQTGYAILVDVVWAEVGPPGARGSYPIKVRLLSNTGAVNSYRPDQIQGLSNVPEYVNDLKLLSAAGTAPAPNYKGSDIIAAEIADS